MSTTIKVKLGLQQMSHASWIVTTMKKLIRTPVNELTPPFLSFKKT